MMQLRDARGILADEYDAEVSKQERRGKLNRAESLRLEAHEIRTGTRDRLAIRAISQAQREALEAAAKAIDALDDHVAAKLIRNLMGADDAATLGEHLEMKDG